MRMGLKLARKSIPYVSIISNWQLAMVIRTQLKIANILILFTHIAGVIGIAKSEHHQVVHNREYLSLVLFLVKAY
jgi:hypothetical protein